MDFGSVTKISLALGAFALSSACACAQEEPHAQLLQLVRRGDDLLAQALAIAQTKPETQSQVDAITDGSGRRWNVDENALQVQLDSLLDRYRDLPSDMREGVNRLLRFENYAFDGLTHLAFCEDAEADWDLAIAAQFLQHARLAAEGHPDPDWHPDILSDPKAKGACR